MRTVTTLLVAVVAFVAPALSQSTPRLYLLDSGVNYVPVDHGPDYVDGSHVDTFGHGTVTAQIARNNGAGPITSVRVLNGAGFGTIANIAAGMQWVWDDYVANGYQPSAVLMAINSSEGHSSWDSIVVGSTQAGLTWVVSAGKDSNWTMFGSPQRAELWNNYSAAIVVAGANGLAHAAPSNYGGEVDLYADNCALGWCGSSMAAAKVAGDVIQILTASPWAPAPHVTSVLTGSCLAWMTAPASGTTPCKR